jgi:fructokinase
VIRRFTLRDDMLLPTRPVRVCDLNLRSPYYDRNLVRETLAHCDWVKLNGDELEELVGMVPLSQLTTRSPAIQLRVVYDLRLVCVTHGSEGVFLAWEGGELAVPGVPADVVDTVGAGDAFTAALLCLHLEGRPFRDCARFAVRYAARVCEFPESTPRIDRAAVERDVAGSRS